MADADLLNGKKRRSIWGDAITVPNETAISSPTGSGNGDSSELVDDSQITSQDVLLGVQHANNNANTNNSVRNNHQDHPGNRVYDSLVETHHKEYQAALSQTAKDEIARTVVGNIISKDNNGVGGRFLVWNPTSQNPICAQQGQKPVESWRIQSYKNSCENVSKAMESEGKNLWIRKLERFFANIPQGFSPKGKAPQQQQHGGNPRSIIAMATEIQQNTGQLMNGGQNTSQPWSSFLEQCREIYWSEIESDLGKDVQTYINHYGFGIIGKSLSQLENAQCGQDREVWAKCWARRLSQPDPEAWQHNMDRKLCLSFLYRLIDNNLLSSFKKYRIDRIIRTCLVMDRANALYNMIDAKTNARGIHWFAEVDRDEMEKLLNDERSVGMLRESQASINRRLRGLLNEPELGYMQDSDVRRWLRPEVAGGGGGQEQDGSGDTSGEPPSKRLRLTLENDQGAGNGDMYNPWRDGTHPFDVMKKITYGPTIEDTKVDLRAACQTWIEELASTESCFDLGKGGVARKFTTCTCMKSNVIFDKSRVCAWMVHFYSIRHRPEKERHMLRLIDSRVPRNSGGAKQDKYLLLEKPDLYICRNAAQAIHNYSKKEWENRMKLLNRNKKEGKEDIYEWTLRSRTVDEDDLAIQFVVAEALGSLSRGIVRQQQQHLPRPQLPSSESTSSPGNAEAGFEPMLPGKESGNSVNEYQANGTDADDDGSVELVDDKDVLLTDVLTGSCTLRNIREHPGNIRYNDLIEQNSIKFPFLSKRDQMMQTRDVIVAITSNGRFLQWNPSYSQPICDVDGLPILKWRVLSKRKVSEKVSSALKNRKRARTENLSHRVSKRTPPEDLVYLEELTRVQQAYLNGTSGHSLEDTSSPERNPDLDVYGKGTGSRNQLGNQHYVALIKANRLAYQNTQHLEGKKRIAESIIFAFETMGGRFVSEDENHEDPKKFEVTLKRVQQALRDALRALNSNSNLSTHSRTRANLDDADETKGQTSISIHHHQDEVNNDKADGSVATMTTGSARADSQTASQQTAAREVTSSSGSTESHNSAVASISPKPSASIAIADTSRIAGSENTNHVPSNGSLKTVEDLIQCLTASEKYVKGGRTGGKAGYGNQVWWIPFKKVVRFMVDQLEETTDGQARRKMRRYPLYKVVLEVLSDLGLTIEGNDDGKVTRIHNLVKRGNGDGNSTEDNKMAEQRIRGACGAFGKAVDGAFLLGLLENDMKEMKVVLRKILQMILEEHFETKSVSAGRRMEWTPNPVKSDPVLELPKESTEAPKEKSAPVPPIVAHPQHELLMKVCFLPLEEAIKSGDTQSIPGLRTCLNNWLHSLWPGADGKQVVCPVCMVPTSSNEPVKCLSCVQCQDQLSGQTGFLRSVLLDTTTQLKKAIADGDNSAIRYLQPLLNRWLYVSALLPNSSDRRCHRCGCQLNQEESNECAACCRSRNHDEPDRKPQPFSAPSEPSMLDTTNHGAAE